MDNPTLFHRILNRELPADILFEDEDVLVFRDIHPKAPTHLLFLSKKFVASVKDTDAETEYLPCMLLLKARDFAREHDIEGYQLTYHVGKEGGQEVPYLHLHFLAQKVI